jgi:DNA-binding IclR family transcriptional regulator
VLAALSGGDAMTAGQVADKTGLARGTVSTTLSKLAKSGEVQKAERGYRLTPTAEPPASPPPAPPASPSPAPPASGE